jgi:peptidoglycan/LPS O-acetylase OafA/YrhL
VILVLRLPAPTKVAVTATWALELPALRRIGLCSYSVYLWHFPVVWWLRQHLEASHYAGLGGLVRSGLLVAVPTLVLAALTYRFVELPAMRRKRRTSSPATTLATAP